MKCEYRKTCNVRKLGVYDCSKPTGCSTWKYIKEYNEMMLGQGTMVKEDIQRLEKLVKESSL